MGQREITPVSSTVSCSHPAISTPTSSAASGLGFRHEALLYAGGDAGFLQGTVGLVADAVEDDAAVLIAVAQPRAQALREALGDYAGRVPFAAMHELGRNPARIIAIWDSFLEEHGGEHSLAIGEPAWPGRSPAELSECERHESLLNVAFESGPSWHLLCPYDLDGLDDRVIEAARRTHPILARNGRSRISERYPGPHREPRPFSGDLPAPSAPYVALAFTVKQLAEIRQDVCEWATQQSLGLEESEELVLAVNELTTNSVRHGGGRGVLRMWREGETLLCEVQDEGQITLPLVGRRRPGSAARNGRGVWIANQLCDLVQIRSAPARTVVRVHKSLA